MNLSAQASRSVNDPGNRTQLPDRFRYFAFRTSRVGDISLQVDGRTSQLCYLRDGLTDLLFGDNTLENLLDLIEGRFFLPFASGRP